METLTLEELMENDDSIPNLHLARIFLLTDLGSHLDERTYRSVVCAGLNQLMEEAGYLSPTIYLKLVCFQADIEFEPIVEGLSLEIIDGCLVLDPSNPQFIPDWDKLLQFLCMIDPAILSWYKPLAGKHYRDPFF